MRVFPELRSIRLHTLAVSIASMQFCSTFVRATLSILYSLISVCIHVT
jgi:hypothetical protein